MGSHQVHQRSCARKLRGIGHGGQLAGRGTHQLVHELQVRFQQVVRVLGSTAGVGKERAFKVNAGHEALIRELHVELDAPEEVFPGSGNHACKERRGS